MPGSPAAASATRSGPTCWARSGGHQGRPEPGHDRDDPVGQLAGHAELIEGGLQVSGGAVKVGVTDPQATVGPGEARSPVALGTAQGLTQACPSAAQKIASDGELQRSGVTKAVKDERRRKLNRAVIADFAGTYQNAMRKAVADAWAEWELPELQKQLRDAQAREEADQARDWIPWFTSLPVIVWSGAVTELRKASRSLRSKASETRTSDKMKKEDSARGLLAEVKSGTKTLTEAAGPLQNGADRVSGCADLTEELRGQIGILHQEVKEANSKALIALNAFINEFDAINGDTRAEKFAELGKDGSPVSFLQNLAYNIYAEVDPTEASAFALGRDAGEKFIGKFPAGPQQG